MRNQDYFIIPVDKFDPINDYRFCLSKHNTDTHKYIP